MALELELCREGRWAGLCSWCRRLLSSPLKAYCSGAFLEFQLGILLSSPEPVLLAAAGSIEASLRRKPLLDASQLSDVSLQSQKKYPTSSWHRGTLVLG